MRREALMIAGLSIAALLLGSLAAQASGWGVSIGFGYPGYVYSPYWNPYAYPYAAPVYYPPYAYGAPPLPSLYYHNLNNYYGVGRYYRPFPYRRFTQPFGFRRATPFGQTTPRRFVRR
jgi:hypothetical protein